MWIFLSVIFQVINTKILVDVLYILIKFFIP